VDIPDGFSAIEDLKVGDLVYGFTESNELVPCDVTKTYRTIQAGYYVINGTLRVTATHPFFIDGEWVEVSEIKVGDTLTNKDLEPIIVESIEFVSKMVRAYNIEVADAHTFFVDGILVHNKDPDPWQP
jgi:intein/homing endonuclease